MIYFSGSLMQHIDKPQSVGSIPYPFETELISNVAYASEAAGSIFSDRIIGIDSLKEI